MTRCGDRPNRALARRASKAAKRTLDPDEVSIFPSAGKRPALLFGTVMGDEVHITGPVLFVPPGERAIVALPTEGRRQLGLGFERSLVLLADEYTGVTPVVIDMNSGAQRFRAEGFGATWIPARARP